MVRPSNIRNTHFSRNPKIAAFLKTYHYVKEFGEGIDRIFREQESNGAKAPTFRTDDFILRITVPKVTEKVTDNREKVAKRVAEKVTVSGKKVAENANKLREKRQQLVEKSTVEGFRLTANILSILELMMENPYISRREIATILGISETSIYRNIESMRGKYLRRVGPDKGGFWEILID
jgi:ATP-dependent DNA helicase RecG